MLAATRNMSALAGCLARTPTAERYPDPPPSSFPQLYSSVEFRKHISVMQNSVVLTGLASSMAEKAGSQLLLDVLLACWRLLPLTVSFSLAEIAFRFYS